MSELNNDSPVDPPRRRNFHRGFEFFASPPDRPRVRWSSDVALAVAGGVLIVILAVVRGDGTSVDEAWGAVVKVLPAW